MYPSEYLKPIFDGLIADNDGFGLLVFCRSIGEEEWIDLYNSFAPGTVTRFKFLADALCLHGFLIAEEYRFILSGSDDLARLEAVSELTEAELEFCQKREIQ